MIKQINKTLIALSLLVFGLIFFILPAKAIKVGLYTSVNEVIIGTSKGGMLSDRQTGQNLTIISPMKAYKLIKNGNEILLSTDGKNYQVNSNAVTIKPTESDGLVYAKKRWYRGSFLVLNTGSGLILINDVDLESYIQGVVPSEMPARWNSEALKAQAIAARSFAVANMGKRARSGFDVNDTTQDQVYKGASAETIKTNDLVRATRGQVLVYGNKVIPAYYHASSGGHTLPSSAVWNKDLPFLRPVEAYDEAIPKNGHGIGMSQHGANILANAGYTAYQILGYFYQNVRLYSLQY